MATFVVVCGLVAAVSSTLLAFGKLVGGSIYTATTSFLLLSSNLDALQKKMKDLGDLVDQVNQQVDDAERNRGAATYQATEWRRKTQDAMAVAEEIMNTASLSEGTTETRVSGGCFFRCSLGKRVSKTLKELKGLEEAYPTQIVLPSHHREPQVEHTPTVSLEDQPTATRNLAKLMELLNRDGVRSIGVWGMGGVGKTTLLKNLNNKLHSLSSSTQSFGKVIWTVVSREMNHKQVQKKIAQRLDFDLRDGDEVSMAAQLHKRLLQEDKFILILDDVWELIDVYLLGIPLPEVHKGYKILLTTQSQAICHQMKMAEQFKILPLNDDEAWQLFRTIVGEVANLEDIIPHAQLVNRECNGLQSRLLGHL